MAKTFVQFVFLVVSVLLVFFMGKACVEIENKKCTEESGFYFKGRCIKNGKIIW